MSGIWNLFGSEFMPLIRLDALLMLDRPASARPTKRSKHTVAQDQRAAAKRRAVKRAKARGQT